MSDTEKEVLDKMRRSISQEFVRAESDFDATRDIRQEMVGKLREAANKVNLLNEAGKTDEDTDTGLRVITATLKAIEDVEKASSKMILLKQKQQEQNLQSAAANRERLEVVIRATAPGRIEESVSETALEDHLEEMFAGEIKDFELKTSPRDLSDK